jgi:hypothetical protein
MYNNLLVMLVSGTFKMLFNTYYRTMKETYVSEYIFKLYVSLFLYSYFITFINKSTVHLFECTESQYIY